MSGLVCFNNVNQWRPRWRYTATTASVSNNSFEGLQGKYFSFLRTLFHKCHLTLSFFLRTMHLPYFKSSDKLKWDRKEVIYRSLRHRKRSKGFFSIPFESNDPFYNIWLPNFKNITFCRSCFIVLFKVILKSFLLHWLNAKVWPLNTKPYFSVVQYTVIYCTRWF